ncbi:hypothetical protein D3C85_1585890 [compost metagenome]|jgi:hypothetical protein
MAMAQTITVEKYFNVLYVMSYQLAKSHREPLTAMTKIDKSISIGCQISPE